MDLKIAAFYCLYDDFFISEGWLDGRQCAMSTAEVMTAALTAAAFLKSMDIFLTRFQKANSAAARAACHAVSHDEFLENLSCGQLSSPWPAGTSAQGTAKYIRTDAAGGVSQAGINAFNAN